jgi:inorganic pyrophosphatase
MPYDKRGALRVVVERPRGSCLKLSYEASIKASSVSRALPLGVTYPFGWGFIPGTLADDGDPVDALVLIALPLWNDRAIFPSS